MFRFNSLLAGVGLEPEAVRLLRHRHKQQYQMAVYLDAIRREPRFEHYQSGQSNPNVISQISSAQVVASFVVDSRGDTVFVGLWRVKGSRLGHLPDPYKPPSAPSEGSTVFDLERMTALNEYCGRIVVDWGGGERAWVQYAHRRDKQVLELRRQAEEPPFPGFGRFGCALHEVDALPAAWLEPLRASRGVYLLIHRTSGKQYVGSATGSDGLLGRWRCYGDGHGGNLALRELGHGAEEFDVRVLETVGSGATLDDVYELESIWKAKLGSRVQGLNRN